MTLLTELDRPTPPRLSPRLGVQLIGASPGLWRVVDAGGRAVGHLQAFSQGATIRYRARRFHALSRAFRDLGEFWSADDAVECLLFAR